MNRAEWLETFDARVRRRARPDSTRARVEDTGAVVRQVAGPDGWNGVLWSGLGDDAAEVIAAQRDHFAALGVECEWKLYGHDLPADLPRLLTEAGFVPEPTETVMVAATADVAAAPVLPPGVVLVPVTDAEGVERAARLHARVFGVDPGGLRKRLLRRLAEAPGTEVAVMAEAAEGPVSVARLECDGDGFAGLWGGATLPHWRGRGLYRALVAHRAGRAAAAGVGYLYVDARDTSRPILARLGFQALTTTTPFVWRP
ncbi:GNAT family N-acetyltransferase [Stackebrandtia albiflava]|nr:GNAT family N-acetyltransferase [Stackebrandtia albiflava]